LQSRWYDRGHRLRFRRIAGVLQQAQPRQRQSGPVDAGSVSRCAVPSGEHERVWVLAELVEWVKSLLFRDRLELKPSAKRQAGQRVPFIKKYSKNAYSFSFESSFGE